MTDLSFCDTCLFRDSQIAPDTMCARRSLAFVGHIADTIPGDAQREPVDSMDLAITEVPKEQLIGFAEFYVRAAAVCIESVRETGVPVVPSYT
jgi:hypothetical protein